MKKKRTRMSYENKLKIMKEYIEKTGKEIQNKTVYKGYNIGGWQNNLRSCYYKGILNINEELKNAFLELGILREEKVKERLSDVDKYNELIELINKPNPTVEDTNRIQKLSYNLGDKKRKGGLNLSKEQIAVLTKYRLLPILIHETDRIANETNSSLERTRRAIRFLRENALEEDIDINKFIEYLDILTQKNEIDPIIINAYGLSEETKKLIYKKIFDTQDFPDIYLDYEKMIQSFDSLRNNNKNILNLRFSKNFLPIRSIASEVGQTHQNVSDVINRTLKDLKNSIKLDIKDDIYANIFLEKQNEILSYLTENYDENKKTEKQVIEAIEYINSIIQIEDLCVPNSTIRILREKGINSIEDLKNAIDDDNKKISIEDKELVLKLIEECNLTGRIQTLNNSFAIDLEKLINSAKTNNKGLIKINDVNLSVRTFNALKRAKITHIGDILILGKKELSKIKGLGDKGYNEVLDILKQIGLKIDLSPETKKELVVKNLLNGYDFLIKIRDIDKETLSRRIELYNQEMNKYFDGRDSINCIEQNYLEAINKFFEEQEKDDTNKKEKETLINGILRKQLIVKRQEEEIASLRSKKEKKENSRG